MNREFENMVIEVLQNETDRQIIDYVFEYADNDTLGDRGKRRSIQAVYLQANHRNQRAFEKKTYHLTE